MLYDYGTLAFATDLLTIAAQVPGALKVGGNTGKVNSFAGVDVGNLTGNLPIWVRKFCFEYTNKSSPLYLTGGLFTTIGLLTDPSALVCFLYQFLGSVVPGLLRSRGGLLGDTLGAVLGLIKTLVTDRLLTLIDPNCPKIGVWDDALLTRFPGSNIGK